MKAAAGLMIIGAKCRIRN